MASAPRFSAAFFVEEIQISDLLFYDKDKRKSHEAPPHALAWETNATTTTVSKVVPFCRTSGL